jgi:hypothetical protein
MAVGWDVGRWAGAGAGAGAERAVVSISSRVVLV